MTDSNEKLISWLFKTNAVRVCPEDKPFWYTSGTIGPYYINTHFLYGSEDSANGLLKMIDTEKNKMLECPSRLLEVIKVNYAENEIFRGLIDEMLLFIKENINIDEVDYISGGERRDWFFSLIVANLLQKPHITIYKDLSMVLTKDGSTKEIKEIGTAKVLHIADLITEASSYQRAWIPAIRSLGAELKWSVVVVDRKQGGEEYLSGEGIKALSMIKIEKSLFNKALEMNLINRQQNDMLMGYIDNPKESMKDFLKRHPEFMKNSLEADVKTRERAQLCIEKNIYG